MLCKQRPNNVGVEERAKVMKIAIIVSKQRPNNVGVEESANVMKLGLIVIKTPKKKNHNNFILLPNLFKFHVMMGLCVVSLFYF